MNTKTAIILANLESVDVERLVAAHNYMCIEVLRYPDDEIFSFDYLCDEVIPYMSAADLLKRLHNGYDANDRDECIDSFRVIGDGYYYFNRCENLCSIDAYWTRKKTIDFIKWELDTSTACFDDTDIDELLDLLDLTKLVPEEEEEEE